MNNIRVEIISSILFIFTMINVNGQNVYRYQVSSGIGLSLLGSGDFTVLNIENEVGYSINNWLFTSLSLNYGRAFTNFRLYSLSFLQGNLNIYISLFNRKRVSLNLGTGVSIFDLNAVRTKVYPPDNLFHLYFEDYTTYGYNLIIEPRVSITERLFVKLKFMAQLYQNGDTNAGGICKLGYRFNL